MDQIDNIAPQHNLSILWVPGHEGIPGNEKADEVAKEVAKPSLQGWPFKHPPQKSCRTQEIKAEAQETWRKLWTHSDKAGHLRRILSREGTEAGPKLYNNIPDRRSVSTLVQLRTGHCMLNKYLYRIGKKDSPECTCEHGIESVEHYLLECPKYQGQRAELREAVKPGDMTVAKLLGNCKTFKHTMEYIRATGRMEDRET